jgi:hypothetical protein
MVYGLDVLGFVPVIGFVKMDCPNNSFAEGKNKTRMKLSNAFEILAFRNG